MDAKTFILLLIAFLSVGCSEYHKITKSTDPDLKYQKAVEYYDNKQYVRAQSLFDDVSSYYRGTERSEDILNYLSRCYMGQKAWSSAADYYETYIRNYPKGRYIIEARYQIGHCYYMDSPDARLDQSTTKSAIEYLTQFMELYPESPYVQEALKELNEMYDKLAKKEFLTAKLYYNLGTYLGNNYEACVIVAQNALRKYPSNSYQEDLSWYILQAKYQLVLRSVEEKKLERAIDASDECYAYSVEYPESKHLKSVDKMQDELKKLVAKLEGTEEKNEKTITN